MLLPIVAAPIVGKTLRNLTYENELVSIGNGWFMIVQIPLAIILCGAVWLICSGIKRQSAKSFAAIGLLLTTLLYFGLNTAFFRYAWPWEEWTTRTPNQIIFSVCALTLVTASAVCGLTRIIHARRARLEVAVFQPRSGESIKPGAQGPGVRDNSCSSPGGATL